MPKITDYAELDAAPAAADQFLLVDVSDTTMAGTGTTKRIDADRLVVTDGSVATVTGGGTVALAGFTATVPATGTVALASGISGGQTIKGGTAASNNLTLESTSHATEGYIVAADDLKANKKVIYTLGATDIISSGAITPTSTFINIRSETAGVADDLDTISGGVDGQLAILRPHTTSGNVTVKHGTDNIALNGLSDFELGGRRDKLVLIYDADVGDWCELSRSTNV